MQWKPLRETQRGWNGQDLDEGLAMRVTEKEGLGDAQISIC